MSFCFVNLFAQHISFMGIQLGQSERIVDRMIRQKGFTFDGHIRYTDNMRYKGPFWKYEEVILSTHVDNNKVTEIVLSPTLGTYETKFDFNNLVNNVDKKHGKHHPISNFFHYSDFAKYDGYYWRVAGGYIVTYYVKKPVGDELMIYLHYIDYTDKQILLENGRKRNTNDDL